MTHGCDVKSCGVTSKKWQFVKNKNEFGYVHRKVRKYECKMRDVEMTQVHSINRHELRKPAGVETEFGDNENSVLRTPLVGNNRIVQEVFES